MQTEAEVIPLFQGDDARMGARHSGPVPKVSAGPDAEHDADRSDAELDEAADRLLRNSAIFSVRPLRPRD